ncbi:hypothetical protein P7C73_g1451, partial [Tremellales sp. Uapishka_1]
MQKATKNPWGAWDVEEGGGGGFETSLIPKPTDLPRATIHNQWAPPTTKQNEEERKDMADVSVGMEGRETIEGTETKKKREKKARQRERKRKEKAKGKEDEGGKEGKKKEGKGEGEGETERKAKNPNEEEMELSRLAEMKDLWEKEERQDKRRRKEDATKAAHHANIKLIAAIIAAMGWALSMFKWEFESQRFVDLCLAESFADVTRWLSFVILYSLILYAGKERLSQAEKTFLFWSKDLNPDLADFERALKYREEHRSEAVRRIRKKGKEGGEGEAVINARIEAINRAHEENETKLRRELDEEREVERAHNEAQAWGWGVLNLLLWLWMAGYLAYIMLE